MSTTVTPGIAATMKHFVIVTLAFLLCAGRVAMETTAASIANMTTSAGTTPIPDFNVDILHKESTTSSIKIQWDIPGYYHSQIMEYTVLARKTDSDAILRSPTLNSSHDTYEVMDLMTNCHYEICVVTSFKEGYEFNSTDPQHQICEELYTIALIRRDSVLALFIALGYILLMILVGYLCWRCAVRRLRAKEAGSEEEHEELLEKADDSGQQLLAPPAQARPRSSIEEELPYIPYITPPIEELPENEKPGQMSTANNI